jgi:cytochrome c556
MPLAAKIAPDATGNLMKIVSTALAAMLVCAAAEAAAAHKPENVIHYRQSAMTLIGWNFAPLSAMVKGKLNWDAKEFALRADRIASLAPQIQEGFAKGSDKGAETDAKADIWSNPEDFQGKVTDFIEASKALADIARNGDDAKTKEEFKKLAGACKSCHDKFKAD